MFMLKYVMLAKWKATVSAVRTIWWEADGLAMLRAQGLVAGCRQKSVSTLSGYG
jgi:hypothetical protein